MENGVSVYMYEISAKRRYFDILSTFAQLIHSSIIQPSFYLSSSSENKYELGDVHENWNASVCFNFG